jgi:5'-nucleotidase
MTAPLILLTNDDGIHAPGLAALERAFAGRGEIWTVAPDREQSAVGHGISLDAPLRALEFSPRRVAVSGTPADCVYYALVHGLPRRPALVVSGINRGNNVGDDVFYSGTVAAAIEACLHDVAGLSVSCGVVGPWTHGAADALLDRVGGLAAEVGAELMERGVPPRTFLNLNAPAALAQDAKVLVTSLGKRHYERAVDAKTDPRGRAYYWIGGPEQGYDDVPGTDCVALATGHASLTPIRLDLNDAVTRETLSTWRVATESPTIPPHPER